MKANKLESLTTTDGTTQLVIGLSGTVNHEKITKLRKAVEDGKLLEVDIKQYRKPRSNTANKMLWQLLDKLAIPLRSTKEEIYHEAVRKVGLFDEFEIAPEAVKSLLTKWCKKGEGWQAEVSNTVTADGKRIVRLYSGSSVYNSLEFSRLIDYVIEECKSQGIETEPPEEIERLVNMIGK